MLFLFGKEMFVFKNMDQNSFLSFLLTAKLPSIISNFTYRIWQIAVQLQIGNVQFYIHLHNWKYLL